LRAAAPDLLRVVEMLQAMLDVSRARPTVQDMAALERQAAAAAAKAKGETRHG
jgi:hypothetical protein